MTSPRAKATPTVLIDNERVVTTQWAFSPNSETGWHRHGHDYVVLPLTGGALTLEEPGGVERVVQLTAGVPYYRGEGVEHNVVNATTQEIIFVEVEIK